MTESKDRYIQFCQSEYVPMHLQPWWLDAVCLPGYWDVALATDAGGAITGVLPWFQIRRWGLRVIQLPPLTTYAGPWFRYPDEPNFKLHSRYAFEKHVSNQLISKLPPTAFFLQNFRPEIENWLAFYWKNYRQSTRYTYIIDKTVDPEAITAGMKNTLRTDLKKARLLAEWKQEDEAWETIFNLNTQSFLRRNLRSPHDRAAFVRLHHALAERGQMACFIARDRVSGEPHAGLYLVADTRQASVFLTGTNPDYKASCAIYGLIMEAIQWCGQRHLSLDFEGSMQPDIERTFRAFGARQQPYFQVWKGRNRFLEVLFHLSR